MASFGDILSGAVKWLGSPTAQTIGNLASTGFDIYGGIQSLGQQQSLYDQAMRQAQFSESQMKQLAGLQFPISQLQAQYALEDLKRFRPSSVAQQEYGVQRAGTELGIAKETDPLIDEAMKSVIGRLTEGEGPLRDRLRGQATADVAAAFQQSADQEQRRLRGLGVSPTSGLAQDYGQRQSQAQALAQAGARTQASRTAEDLALSRNIQAMNMRMGIPVSPQQYTPSMGLGQIASAAGASANNAGRLSALAGSMAGDQFSGAQYSFNKALAAAKGIN